MERKQMIDKQALLDWLYQQNGECVIAQEKDMNAAYVHTIRQVRSGRFDVKESSHD